MGALPLDALPAAREAEFVMSLGGALHEVGVLEPLLAQGALEQRVRHRVGHGRGGHPLLGGTALSRAWPRTGDPPTRRSRRARTAASCRAQTRSKPAYSWTAPNTTQIHRLARSDVGGQGADIRMLRHL